MAEAHAAVAFQFNVSRHGLTVDYDKEILRELIHSTKRSWRYRLIRFLNRIRNMVFPFTVPSVLALIALTSSLTLSDYFDPLSGYARRLHALVPWRISALYPKQSYIVTTVSACAAAVGVVVFLTRFFLEKLLHYRGALRERRGKYSWRTKLWFIWMKVVQGNSTPRLYSYQDIMPVLPLPSLRDTIPKYLRSMRPLLDDEKYERMVQLAADFQNGQGRRFQRYLIMKWLFSTNYVSDWWEEYVYLRGRGPLLINSNCYAMDALHERGSKRQAARAANLTHALLKMRRMINQEDVMPLMLDKMIPLDSFQYPRTFDTCRIPGRETDKHVHYDSSTHVVVFNRGRYFWVPTHTISGRLLNPKELEMQFDRVLQDSSKAREGEELVAALTAGDRVLWAEARERYFSRGPNRVSLETIERAAFYLVLDEEEDYYFDASDPSRLDDYCKWLLQGACKENSCKLWCDKSFSLLIMKNGLAGVNFEHSWGDGLVAGHIWEWALTEDLGVLQYDADGHTRGSIETVPQQPQRLKFELSEECLLSINKSFKTARSLCDDLDLRVLMFNDYGKGFMKTCKVSPDAYIQLALQLAYRRDAGNYCQTYEATTARLFREGRTETVRPCTIESKAFVEAMLNENATNAERQRLLRIASEVHTAGYMDSMCGKGVDRHLFCLYVVSKYLAVESPFLKDVISEPWRLSTSQTPQNQTGRLDPTRHPEQVAPGGGFGPVADDGYGVCYFISGDAVLFFHVTCKISSEKTDANRFREMIRSSLHLMADIFKEEPARDKAPLV
ncbi:hypothetical protein RvY_08896 [Ramazzottius varieornatus]|uniref:carnitine O-palmitoyltransferase n=1 Tax=Ramazzottius varieornatus TaxID=947166 RepID=A0A1D1V9M5_RAMVA|nr:hypothetical protein RvY_08896 [Ramazzottius varieornatus]